MNLAASWPPPGMTRTTAPDLWQIFDNPGESAAPGSDGWAFPEGECHARPHHTRAHWAGCACRLGRGHSQVGASGVKRAKVKEHPLLLGLEGAVYSRELQSGPGRGGGSWNR